MASPYANQVMNALKVQDKGQRLRRCEIYKTVITSEWDCQLGNGQSKRYQIASSTDVKANSVHRAQRGKFSENNKIKSLQIAFFVSLLPKIVQHIPKMYTSQIMFMMKHFKLEN